MYISRNPVQMSFIVFLDKFNTIIDLSFSSCTAFFLSVHSHFRTIDEEMHIFVDALFSQSRGYYSTVISYNTYIGEFLVLILIYCSSLTEYSCGAPIWNFFVLSNGAVIPPPNSNVSHCWFYCFLLGYTMTIST